MGILLMAFCLAVAVFAAIGLFIYMTVGERSPAEARLAELRTGRITEEKGDFLDALEFRDLFSVVTRPLAPFREWMRSRDDQLAYRLSLAGYRKPEDVDTFLSCKILAPILGILLATFAGSDNFLFCAILFGLGGFFAPDIFLFTRIGKRKTNINKALPDALDLLVICIEAGLGIDQAT